jgi:diguanylate cyclase (GGDEF)-like protein
MADDDSKLGEPPARVGMIESRRYLWNSRRAGLLRVMFAALGVLAIWFIPGLLPYRSIFITYFVLSLISQALIRKHMGRTAIVLAMGMLDVAFVTLLVHVLGSTRTVLSFLYLLIPIVFATTTSRRRVSMTLALAAAFAYLLVLGLEALHVLPFAPGVPGAEPPSKAMVLFCGLIVVIAIVSTTRFVSQLIAALREANARLREQSQRDELTGLYNRRYLHSRLDSELARVKRGGKLMVMMVDLDGFKRVNDEIGHGAGDKMLRAVAGALLSATRRSDVVARYGGDEFVVLLPDTAMDGCQAVASRVVDHARDVARATFASIPVTASVGIASATKDDDAAALLRRADEAVYTAKRRGGDRAA